MVGATYVVFKNMDNVYLNPNVPSPPVSATRNVVEEEDVPVKTAPNEHIVVMDKPYIDQNKP